MPNWDHEDLKQPHNKKVDEEEIKKAMMPDEKKRRSEIDKIIKMLTPVRHDDEQAKRIDELVEQLYQEKDRNQKIAGIPQDKKFMVDDWAKRVETAITLTSGSLSAPDPVNHPSHYTSSPAQCQKCGTPIECIDVVEHMGFSIGNTIKYLWRAGKKDDHLQDLKKARWYLDREISKLEKERKGK